MRDSEDGKEYFQTILLLERVHSIKVTYPLHRPSLNADAILCRRISFAIAQIVSDEERYTTIMPVSGKVISK